MLKQETGILLLAIGHPYYGRMAYNLAMSIKAVDASVNITLVYTDTAIAHINQRNMWVFDNKMPYPQTEKPFGVKLELYDLTPYERTLYIDVDALWVNKKSPAALFEQLKGVPFTGITEGFHDYANPTKSEPSKNYFFWADLEEIRSIWALTGKIYQWRSEFMYFEKSEAVQEMFDLAQSVYHTNIKSVKLFADNIPDELAFNIAACVHEIHPHIYKWRPSYWDRLNGDSMPPIEALQNSYYIISCGSNASGGALKRVYDRITAACAYRLKLQHVFPLISKKEMLINRQLM